MSFSVAELQKIIEQGGSLEALGRSLMSAAERGLLKCCAVVRTFDESLVDDYFRPQVPGAGLELDAPRTDAEASAARAVEPAAVRPSDRPPVRASPTTAAPVAGSGERRRR